MEMKDFDSLCLDFQKLKDQKAELNDQLSEIEAKIVEKENMILAELSTLDLERFSFSNGLVSKTHQTQFKKVNPEEFKQYMKDNDMWDQLADINYQTLRAIINQKKKEAEDAGNFDFRIPGLEITEIEKLSLRKK